MPDPTRTWTAALIVIGDEILSGRTQDRNVAQIATWLNVQGIRLREVRVVADDQNAIVEAVNALRARGSIAMQRSRMNTAPTRFAIGSRSIRPARGSYRPASVPGIMPE